MTFSPFSGDVKAGAAVDRVGAGAAVERVVAVAALDEVVAVVAVDRVVALAADEDVVVVAAVERQEDTGARKAGGADEVGAGQGVDRQGVVGRLGVGDRDVSDGRGERDGPGAAGEAHHVHAGRAVDDDRVGRAVAGAGDAEVEVDGVHVGRGQVVDRDRVGAAQGVEREHLHVVGVHDDVAEVAGEQQPAAVGRGGEDLGAGGAVEAQRVGAVLALDDVAAVARIPDERVVAGPQEAGVGALVAVDRVVAGPADQGVGAVAAVDRVVAVAAVEGELDEGSEGAAGERVVCRPGR